MSALGQVQKAAEARQKRRERIYNPKGWHRDPEALERVAEAGRLAIRDYALAEAAQHVQDRASPRNGQAWQAGKDFAVRCIHRVRAIRPREA